MTHEEKFDIFNKTYEWQYYVLANKVTIEFKPIGAKHTEFISGKTLDEAFENVFNHLKYE